MKTVLEFVGVYNNIHLFERDGEVGFFENTEDPKYHMFLGFDNIKECDDVLWKTYRISLVDFPYFRQNINTLAKSNDDWKEVYEKYKIRIA